MGVVLITILTSLPFSRFIKDYIPRAENPIPKMTFYNGKDYPHEHVTQYERHMRLARHNETTTCQMFEVDLKDVHKDGTELSCLT